MSLFGKKVLCVGGNGYIGNYLASRLVNSNAKVTILSRTGPKYQYKQNRQVDWVIADIFQTKKIEDKINDADVIIHTVGTLFDSSIIKNQKPGGPGTYEALNRDSLVSVLNTLKSKKQIFYLSAVGHPPFVHRYASTKQEAEQILLNSLHESFVVKPGFVYNWQNRKWSIPLKYSIKIWNKIFPFLLRLAFNGTYIQKFLKEFEQSEPTALTRMGDAVIQLIYKGSEVHILKNQQINKLSEQYRQRIKLKEN